MRVLLLLVAALAACNSAPVRKDTAVYDAPTFFKTTNIRGASFSADGSRILITTDQTGVYNVYSQPVAGGRRKALSRSKSDHVMAVSYFPNDNRVLYTADQGGNELNHLYVREASGATTDLTPGEKLKARFLGWSGDDRHFHVATNERDPRHFDVYRYATAAGYERTLLFRNDGGFGVSGVSKNGRFVALTKTRSNADNDIYLWDAQNAEGAPKRITPHEGDVQHSVATFSPDNRKLWYISNAGSEFRRAWTYHIGSGDHGAEEERDWDIQFISFSRDGRFRAMGVNEDAETKVTVVDTQTGKTVFKEAVSNVTFSRDGGRIAYYVNRDTSPANLYVLDLPGGERRKLTTSLNPKVREEHLVEAKVIRYRSFDGVQIPALLYRPQQASRTKRVPGLVWVHGGPGGQSRKGYRAVIQYLVNHGYAVLAVNNRGSSGYGKTFHHLDDKRHGQDDLLDCVAGRRYLEKQSWIDGGRVGIIGGSYGGYMVVAALAFTPDAFDVGIDIFGVTNWVRTLKSIPPWWTSFRDYLYAELGDPATEEEALRKKSPLFHAGNIKKPLLVIQGANDPRVLKVESDEMVTAVRANGVPVEYIVFDDEGHGFRRRANRIRAAEAYRKFLDRYLKRK